MLYPKYTKQLQRNIVLKLCCLGNGSSLNSNMADLCKGGKCSVDDNSGDGERDRSPGTILLLQEEEGELGLWLP